MELKAGNGYWSARFRAMASPCEVLIDTADRDLALAMAATARDEALRIEAKYSRYRQDNIIDRINHANGSAITVDEETAALLDYAKHCYQLSHGLFDITSGVLRQAWCFDGSDKIPKPAHIKALLRRMGWRKLQWQPPVLRMPKGFEIDLGSIGKEYAVDRSAQLLAAKSNISFLLNYGGDLYSNRPRSTGKGWMVGLERPQADPSSPCATEAQFELRQGGIATSGDTHRYLLHQGIRYPHILNPRNGWPVEQAPRSITVLAASCTEAGILSTLAMLHGKEAEAFLTREQIRHWVIR